VKISCTDEEKSDFTIRVEKDSDLRQKVLNATNIYAKLQKMFLGRFIYNDTLVKVTEIQPDKRFDVTFEHEEEKYNLEMAIELQGEKSDARSVINYCREILKLFQNNNTNEIDYKNNINIFKTENKINDNDADNEKTRIQLSKKKKSD